MHAIFAQSGLCQAAPDRQRIIAVSDAQLRRASTEIAVRMRDIEHLLGMVFADGVVDSDDVPELCKIQATITPLAVEARILELALSGSAQ